MTDTPINVDNLPPTQNLMLELLAARYRLGEQGWTFPSGSAFRVAADRLANLGLVGWKSGTQPKTILVWFTDAGQALMLSHSYTPPILRRKEPEQPPLDLRALAVILNCGYEGATKMQDAGLAQTLWYMTEQVVALIQGQGNPIGNLDEEFAQVEARYQ